MLVFKKPVSVNAIVFCKAIDWLYGVTSLYTSYPSLVTIKVYGDRFWTGPVLDTIFRIYNVTSCWVIFPLAFVVVENKEEPEVLISCTDAPDIGIPVLDKTFKSYVNTSCVIPCELALPIPSLIDALTELMYLTLKFVPSNRVENTLFINLILIYVVDLV